jgi:hypothetical protein
MEEQVINTTRQVAYHVGEVQPYQSIYGYPKRRRYVYRLKPGESPEGSGSWRNPGNCIGYVKEERIADENGNVVTTVFYEKNGWRKHGLVRFYASPEALLIGCGLTPVLGLGDKADATAKIKELSQQVPEDTPPLLLLGNVQPNGALMLTHDKTPALPAPPRRKRSVKKSARKPTRKVAKKVLTRGAKTRLTAASKRKKAKKRASK